MTLLKAAWEYGIGRRVGNGAAAERGSDGGSETQPQDLDGKYWSCIRKSGHESCPSRFLRKFEARKAYWVMNPILPA